MDFYFGFGSLDINSNLSKDSPLPASHAHFSPSVNGKDSNENLAVVKPSDDRMCHMHMNMQTFTLRV